MYMHNSIAQNHMFHTFILCGGVRRHSKLRSATGCVIVDKVKGACILESITYVGKENVK